MLRLIGFITKITIFSLFVLVLGNWIRWDGKTISDQIKVKMSHADELGLMDHFRTWTERITTDARKGFQKKNEHSSHPEEIPSSERQKLKAPDTRERTVLTNSTSHA